jgi:restriction system protein
MNVECAPVLVVESSNVSTERNWSMAIPDYQRLMLPVLLCVQDGEEHRFGDVVEALAEQFDLSADEQAQLLGSGQTVLSNRTGWARTYLKKAGLIEPTRRGAFRITESGLSVLASNPERIDVKFLMQFPEFVAFRRLRHERDEEKPSDAAAGFEATPEEALDNAHQRLRVDLEAELLEQVKIASPAFFERLVVELLVRMGYGGSLRDAGQAIGKSGDGGIDGIIKEDRLGLEVIYIQAKRWESTVGRPEIQKFAGALQGHRARKGVFMTTALFSSDALEFVSRIDSRIVLIDGPTLVKYMIDSNVGVSCSQSYEVKKIDLDYFVEE